MIDPTYDTWIKARQVHPKLPFVLCSSHKSQQPKTNETSLWKKIKDEIKVAYRIIFWIKKIDN